MALVIILVAAVMAGAGFVLQQRAAEQAPKSSFLRLRLIRYLVVKPRWLLGITVMVAGDVLDAWALGHMRLSLAEPLMTTSLLFALILAVPLSAQQLRKSELAGAVLLCLGVAALAVAVFEPGPGVSIGSYANWPAAAGIGAVAYLFAWAGRRRRGELRATLTGTASGLLFGVADAFTRRTVEIFDSHSLLAVLGSWPLYAMLATTLLGVWLMQSAFNAGPVHASLPGVVAGEPVAGMVLGLVVFGDEVRVSAGMLALEAAGVTALVIGVIMVARGPALGGLHPAHVLPAHRPASQRGRGWAARAWARRRPAGSMPVIAVPPPAVPRPRGPAPGLGAAAGDTPAPAAGE